MFLGALHKLLHRLQPQLLVAAINFPSGLDQQHHLALAVMITEQDLPRRGVHITANDIEFCGTIEPPPLCPVCRSGHRALRKVLSGATFESADGEQLAAPMVATFADDGCTPRKEK